MDWQLTFSPILGAKNIRIYLYVNACTNHCYLKIKMFGLNSVSGFQFSSVFVQIGWHGEWGREQCEIDISKFSGNFFFRCYSHRFNFAVKQIYITTHTHLTSSDKDRGIPNRKCLPVNDVVFNTR
jgi:hypothetical protein